MSHEQEPAPKWEEIARQLAVETDPVKMIQLSHELNETLRKDEKDKSNQSDGNN